MKFDERLSSKQKLALKAVFDLAKICDYEPPHVHHVTYLALRLFDELEELHRLSSRERFWLLCAGLLHDIGWINGWKAHHKKSLEIILNTPVLHMKNKERLIIGSIARYHRKQLPSKEHDHFAVLEDEEQKKVIVLASFLRLANALDHSHKQLVRDIQCRTKSKSITIKCITKKESPEEQKAAQEMIDLLKIAFDREIHLKWS